FGNPEIVLAGENRCVPYSGECAHDFLDKFGADSVAADIERSFLPAGNDQNALRRHMPNVAGIEIPVTEYGFRRLRIADITIRHQLTTHAQDAVAQRRQNFIRSIDRFDCHPWLDITDRAGNLLLQYCGW